MYFDSKKTNPFPTQSDGNEYHKNIVSIAGQRYNKTLKERGKYLHSREHLLADDLSRMMREEKKFAAYLGIAELYYESDLRGLARYVVEKENLPAEARGKYFFAALKGLSKKPRKKLKKKLKKKKVRKSHRVKT